MHALASACAVFDRHFSRADYLGSLHMPRMQLLISLVVCWLFVCSTQARLATAVLLGGVFWALGMHSPDLAHLKSDVSAATPVGQVNISYRKV